MIAITKPDSIERHDILERHRLRIERMIAVVPYALLVISATLAFFTGTGPWQYRTTAVAIAAATAIWLWLMGTRREPGLLFVAVLIVLMAVLGAFDIWYAILFGFTGYLYAWTVLNGAWRFVGLTAAAAVNTAALMRGVPFEWPGVLSYAFFVVVTVLIVSVFCMLGDVTRARSTVYQEMLAKLERTIRENDRLQGELIAQAKKAGVREERQRMAREIHDTLAQGLAGIVTQLQAAERAGLKGDHGPWRHHVDLAIRLTRDSLEEARRSVHAIGPSPLEAASLPDAISRVAEEWTALSAVPVQVSTTGTAIALHPDIESTLLRITQEALANVAKHAEAARVGVTLSYMDDLVNLDVRDDGNGFEPAAAVTDGRYGHSSMRQRVSRVGGELHIESALGSGTAVSASLPSIARDRTVGAHD